MIKFENGEYVIHVMRRHWFFIFLSALGNLILMLLPLLVYFVLTGLGVWSDFVGASGRDVLSIVPLPVVLFFYALWVLIFWSKFFIFWTDYYLDAWYITNTRIIDVEQKGFFKREISSVRYKRIEDITIEVKGLIGTLLDFGKINVQTAGEIQEFTIFDIPRPYAMKEFLGKIIESVTHHKPVFSHDNGHKEKQY